MRSIIFLLIILVLIAGCAEATKKQVITGKAAYNVDYKYTNEIVAEDNEIKALAKWITTGCSSDTCRVYEIYKYVIENFDYSPDTGENIQSVRQTLDSKEGDCEDLTILLISLLENSGIKSFFVLADSHAYALACEIDKEELINYVSNDITYYDAFGYNNCIVLDPSVKAYAGYDVNLEEEKIAIDPVSEELVVLE